MENIFSRPATFGDSKKTQKTETAKFFASQVDQKLSEQVCFY